MNKDILEKIRKDREQPRIAVIGSTIPNRTYSKFMGVDMGYTLRSFLEGRKGTLFTGGVGGVGVDVYQGIVSWCKRFEKKDDRFFVLIPKTVYLTEPVEGFFLYSAPRTYHIIAGIAGLSLEQTTAGDGMGERRKYLAHTADVAVMLNGSFGTLDEALSIIRLGKPVITWPESGGAAKDLVLLKDGRLDEGTTSRLIELDILKMDENLDLVYRVSSSEEIPNKLVELGF